MKTKARVRVVVVATREVEIDVEDPLCLTEEEGEEAVSKADEHTPSWDVVSVTRV